MTDYRSVVEELVATKNKLAIVTNELEALKAKRVQRRKNNPDRVFLNVLTRVRTRIAHQEMQSPELVRRVTLKTLIKENVPQVEFFTKFKNAVKRLLDYNPFVAECEEYSPALDPKAVAQYVVISGDKNVNKVFKVGLKNTFSF